MQRDFRPGLLPPRAEYVAGLAPTDYNPVLFPAMSSCPACDTEIDVDEFDVDRDDQLSCPECGANIRVSAVSPVKLEPVSDDDDDAGEDHPDGDPDEGA